MVETFGTLSPHLEISMTALFPPQRNLPEYSDHSIVFLGGSIEMGKAEDWQKRITQAIEAIDPNILVCNPRRPDWDSTWEQRADNPNFAEQVHWELDHLQRANVVVFYFQPNTMSPITLMELGHTLADNKLSQDTLNNPNQTIVVCCPDGFWRKGNVDIICQRYGIEVHNTLEDMEQRLKDVFQS